MTHNINVLTTEQLWLGSAINNISYRHIKTEQRIKKSNSPQKQRQKRAFHPDSKMGIAAAAQINAEQAAWRKAFTKSIAEGGAGGGGGLPAVCSVIFRTDCDTVLKSDSKQHVPSAAVRGAYSGFS